MKKLIFSLVSLFAMSTAHADEGMWTIYNLPPQVFEQMKAEGFQMSYNDLYYGPNSRKSDKHCFRSLSIYAEKENPHRQRDFFQKRYYLSFSGKN